MQSLQLKFAYKIVNSKLDPEKRNASSSIAPLEWHYQHLKTNKFIEPNKNACFSGSVRYEQKLLSSVRFQGGVACDDLCSARFPRLFPMCLLAKGGVPPGSAAGPCCDFGESLLQ